MEVNEKDILLSLSEEMARVRSTDDLLALVNGKLKELLPFVHGGVGVIEKNKNAYTVFLGDPPAISNMPQPEVNFRTSYFPKNKMIDDVLKEDHPIIADLDELVLTWEAPLYVRLNHASGMKEMILMSLRSKDADLGFFVAVCNKKNSFDQNHFTILQRICGQLSLVVTNILANEAIKEKENERSLLLSLGNDISSCHTYKDIQHIISSRLAKHLPFQEVMICLNSSDNLTHKCYVHTLSPETLLYPGLERVTSVNYFINDGIFNVIESSLEPIVFDMDELVTRENKPFYVDLWHQVGIQEMIGFPVRVSNKCIGIIHVYSRQKNTFSAEKLNLGYAVCSYLGLALSNIYTYEKTQNRLEAMNAYQSQLEQEKQYLQEQIKINYNFEQIIGSGNAFRHILQLVLNVAPSDSTVLILGETGTGKELIASAIHNSSPRRDKLMIKLNCAALPSNLVESELFGHEKGSFTGAIERRIGKFELAHNGTLFLDEIGEMSLDLQVKLLRALQEKEIERIGGRSVIKTNVRVIAASNRDLKKEVEEGRFRTDLFYRLNVFPIMLPPLRDRREDIPLLTSHFIDKFSKRSKQKIKNISPEAVKKLMLYDWPGNVRELEHIIERTILMTSGNMIDDIQFLEGDKKNTELLPESSFQSLKENERAYILAVLKKSNGKIRGPGGAADILQIPPTTLHSKMKKLGIKKAGR